MATTKAKKTTQTKTKPNILNLYMDYVLEHEKKPKSVYKFCKENNIKEETFFEAYCSFESLEKAVWSTFHNHTMGLLEKQGRDTMSPKNQLLTYYFTLFELLSANRSYCLMVLGENKMMTTYLQQLSHLRKHIKDFSKELIEEGNSNKAYKIFQHQDGIFSEAVWIQFMFLLRFWLKDTSAGFEKTDVAIEKSVQTAFDIFETQPLESLLDFGKFLWKEQRM